MKGKPSAHSSSPGSVTNKNKPLTESVKEFLSNSYILWIYASLRNIEELHPNMESDTEGDRLLDLTKLGINTEDEEDDQNESQQVVKKQSITN